MKQIFTVLLIGTTMLVKAQFGVNFGIRANALIRSSSASWKTNDESYNITSKESMGYNGGIFSRIKVPAIPIFLMPELYFTQYNSKATYKSNTILLGNNEVVLTANSFRIDIPVLIGYEFFGIGGVFAGPVFYNQLRSLNSGISKLQTAGDVASGGINNISDVTKKVSESYSEEYISSKTSMGYQFGVVVDIIPKLTITARYEIANKNDERKYVGDINKDEVYYSDRPKFFVLGAGFKF